MKKLVLFFVIPISVIAVLLPLSGGVPGEVGPVGKSTKTIKLPEPRYRGSISVEEALCRRRSIRHYNNEPLRVEEVSQLLWAAQGITDSTYGLRTAPSAGALYPVEIYIVVGEVTGLEAGIYRYNPYGHELVVTGSMDVRGELSESALGQEWVSEAPMDIVICAVYSRVTGKYGDRGNRYVHMEAGHVAQNVYLQAVSLNLGTVVVGAFLDDKVQQVIGARENEVPLYIMPIGKITESQSEGNK